MQNDTFGCAACWPESADAANEARYKLNRERDLIHESHFHAMTVRCRACSQVFLSVFTETVDWADGEDPQYWVTLPLTAEEAADLARQPTVAEGALCALGPGRKSLAYDHPKGVKARSYWRAGMSIGFHD